MDLRGIGFVWNASGPGYGPVAGSCEQGNEVLGSMKGGEFFI
jgi:hypothetical protein